LSDVIQTFSVHIKDRSDHVIGQISVSDLKLYLAARKG
jgi:hypothetical protein